MKDKNITKQYNVFISGSDFGESGSGVLFYPGRETLFVFTCAHVVANHTVTTNDSSSSVINLVIREKSIRNRIMPITPIMVINRASHHR